jgi:hypothetical protein
VPAIEPIEKYASLARTLLHRFDADVAGQLRQRHQEKVNPEKYSHQAHNATNDHKRVQNWIESRHPQSITLIPNGAVSDVY